ncbi:hypothetical protein CFP56_004035, partial [Quercus suber]
VLSEYSKSTGQEWSGLARWDKHSLGNGSTRLEGKTTVLSEYSKSTGQEWSGLARLLSPVETALSDAKPSFKDIDDVISWLVQPASQLFRSM